jgi:hypothetical protein
MYAIMHACKYCAVPVYAACTPQKCTSGQCHKEMKRIKWIPHFKIHEITQQTA